MRLPSTPPRTIATLAFCVCALIAEDSHFFRVQKINTEWRLVDRNGSAVTASLPISSVPLEQPFFAPVPLVPGKQFVDVFAPDFQNALRMRAAAVAKPLKKNHRLAAYLWTDAPPWNRDWVTSIRNLPADADGKMQYLQFLKQSYGYNINELNTAYGLESTSFTDLAVVDWSKLDLNRPAVVKDDDAFLATIADVLCTTAKDVLQSVDPGRLILSTIAAPESVARACQAGGIWTAGQPILRY